MATIGSANNSSHMNTSRLSYVTVAEFSANIFTYTTTTANFQTTGTLTSFNAQGLGAGACLKGRVLRENGRKLYPGAHPSVTTYMVGVYDNQTMLSGFIDPNGPQFAIYNTDKPNFLLDGVDPVGGLTDHGAPVYTNSSVEARTWITADTGNITASLGNIIATAGNVQTHTGLYSDAGQNLVRNIPSYSATVAGGTNTGYSNIDISQGQVIKVSLTTTGTGNTAYQINAIDSTNSSPTNLGNFGGAQIYLIFSINISSLANGNTFTFVYGNQVWENVGGSFVLTKSGGGTQAGTWTAMFICDGIALYQFGTTQQNNLA